MKNTFFATLVAFAIIVNSVSFVSAQSRRETASAKVLFSRQLDVAIRVENDFASETLMSRAISQLFRKESQNNWNFVSEGDNEDYILVVSREETKDNKRTQRDDSQKFVNRQAKKNIRESQRAGNETKRNIKKQIPRKIRGIAGVFTDMYIDRQVDKRTQQTETLIQSDRYVQERMNIIIKVQLVRASDNVATHTWVGNVVLQTITREESGATLTKIADDSLQEKGLPKGTVLTDKNFQTINELALLDALAKSDDGSYTNQTMGR